MASRTRMKGAKAPSSLLQKFNKFAGTPDAKAAPLQSAKKRSARKAPPTLPYDGPKSMGGGGSKPFGGNVQMERPKGRKRTRSH